MIVKNLKSCLNWMMKPMGYANLQVSGHKLGTNKNHTISMNFINSILFVFFNGQYFISEMLKNVSQYMYMYYIDSYNF